MRTIKVMYCAKLIDAIFSLTFHKLGPCIQFVKKAEKISIWMIMNFIENIMYEKYKTHN